MPSQVPTTYVTKFSSNMRMALNQQGSKLRGSCMEETGSGEMYQLQTIIGNRSTYQRKSRNQDVRYDETGFDRVWADAPLADETAEMVDKLDKVRTGIDLQGAYVKAQSGAIRRRWDGTFLGGWDGTGGFYGNMKMGKTGSTLVPFANANIIPVNTGASGATGLNIPKVLAARELLVSGFVDTDQPWYIALTAKQVTNLFNQVQFTSSEFKETYNVRMSADGKKLLGMAGFEFVEMELGNPFLPNYDLTVDGSGYRKLPVWTRDGMCFLPWADQELYTSIDPIPTKGNNLQVLSSTMCNATRTDNARCAIILCN